jgi:RNA-directed DNA polymerase
MKSSNEKKDLMRLKMMGLPLIETLDDFSQLTRFSKKLIYNFSKNSQYYYRTYSIKKKNGKNRTIAQPSRKMKAMQAWILRNILDKLKTSSSCKGFEKGTSILDNASPHVGSNAIMTLDIENFFPSIKSGWIYTIFKSLGYNKFISSVMTSICSYKGYLPQGSPCSPKLSNLVCLRLDSRLQGYVGKRNIVYTRYADDLTFSALKIERLTKSYKTITTIIEDEGFRINNSKTRICGPSKCRKVTGLVIGDDASVGIGRKRLRNIRAKIHGLIKDNIETRNNKLSHIKGWLAFIKSIDDKRYSMLENYIHKLSEEHPSFPKITYRNRS